VPDTGYHFVSWSDGSTDNPRTDTGVTADIAVTANFDINTYTLTYSAGAHGSISGASPQTVNHGADGTAVTAVPDTGYHFANWSDGSTANPRTDTNVTADIAVTANFDTLEYTITSSAISGGSISPAGGTTVAHGQDLSYSAEPDDEYEVIRWSVDGDVVQWGGESYTLSDIQSDHSLSVLFGEVDYAITATAGPGGSVSPEDVSVDSGGNCVFTATPDTGYAVDTWFMDGSVVKTGGVTFEVSPVYTEHTIHVTFRSMLSYSLGTYGFEDEQETEAGVINNNADLDQPDEALVLVEPVGLGLDPDNMAMGLHNRTDSRGQTVNARAKGMFIGTGADEVLIRFKYLFTTSDTVLVIYLSDSPELLTKDDFGVFQKIVWTGHLDCSEGLYIELELIEQGENAISLSSFMPSVTNRRVSTGTASSSVYVDDWSPIIQCYGICLDINWDNFVDEADFLMVIGGSGCSATGEMACLEGAFSTDGYMDSYDVASWDWAMNSDQRLLNYCGLPLTDGSGGIGLMSALVRGPANAGARMALANVPNDLSDMLIAGKRGSADAAGKLKDSLYVFDSTGQCGGSFEPASNRGNIRLVRGPDGRIYVLNSETGLVRLDSTDEVIIPPGKLEFADEPRYNKSATVYVGIQGDGSDAFGRPILDVAFDAEHAYVIPVVVHPDGGEAYTAAAKLKLSAGANPPYELVELYDEPPLPNDNQYRDSLREIEIDSAGNVYVLNVHAINESDILWRYGTNGTVERLDLGWPDGGSYVPAPVGMYVSETTGILYLASAAYNQTDPDSTVIYSFSTQGALALAKSVTINGLQHVTGMTEDPATGTLWVVGFNMHDIPQYPNPTKPAFYYPHLAKISSDDDSVEVIPLFDPASHDLALPTSILWTSTAEQVGVE
jgi:hypothetical protein